MLFKSPLIASLFVGLPAADDKACLFSSNAFILLESYDNFLAAVNFEFAATEYDELPCLPLDAALFLISSDLIFYSARICFLCYWNDTK